MNTIGTPFILNSLKTTTHIAVVGSTTNRSLRSGKKSMNFSNVRGFALLKNKPTFLYLDLICGAGTGAIIFKHIDYIAKRLNHKMIRLSAIPDAMLQYYKSQYGFVFSETCKMNNDVKQVANSVFKEVISLKSTQKNIKSEFNKASTRKEKLRLKRSYKNVSKLVTNQLDKLETILGNKNIVATKGCAATKSCGVNGYTMTKCLL